MNNNEVLDKFTLNYVWDNGEKLSSYEKHDQVAIIDELYPCLEEFLSSRKYPIRDICMGLLKQNRIFEALEFLNSMSRTFNAVPKGCQDIIEYSENAQIILSMFLIQYRSGLSNKHFINELDSVLDVFRNLGEKNKFLSASIVPFYTADTIRSLIKSEAIDKARQIFKECGSYLQSVICINEPKIFSGGTNDLEFLFYASNKLKIDTDTISYDSYASMYCNISTTAIDLLTENKFKDSDLSRFKDIALAFNQGKTASIKSSLKSNITKYTGNIFNSMAIISKTKEYGLAVDANEAKKIMDKIAPITAVASPDWISAASRVHHDFKDVASSVFEGFEPKQIYRGKIPEAVLLTAPSLLRNGGAWLKNSSPEVKVKALSIGFKL